MLKGSSRDMSILKAIVDLFMTPEVPKKKEVKSNYQDFESGIKVKVTYEETGQKKIKVSEDYRPPEKINWSNDDNDCVEKLLKETRGTGNKKYPLIHKDYSENWVIPNFPLSDFVLERILKNDYMSIIRVFDGLSYYSDGLIETILLKKTIPMGTSESNYYWTYDAVNGMKNKRYYEYITFEKARGMNEMKAMWTVLSKSIMFYDSPLLIENEDYLDYISAALACYTIEINPKIYSLIKKANKALKEYHKYNTGLYEDSFTINKNLPSSAFIEKYNNLSIGARINLYLSQICNNNDDLKSCWKYKTLRLGALPDRTTDEILNSGLLDYENVIEELQIEKYFEKAELVKIATEKKLPVKQSWTRVKLVEEINNYDKSIIEKLLGGRPTTKEHLNYSVKPEYKEDFEKLMKVIKDNRVVYDLLSLV